MNFHLLEFFGRQAARLVDDLLGYGQLPDVVQQGRGPERFNLAFRKFQFLGHRYSVRTHALQMRVRGVIFGFDGEGEGFDRPHVQRSDLFHVPLFDFDSFFFCLKPS